MDRYKLLPKNGLSRAQVEAAIAERHDPRTAVELIDDFVTGNTAAGQAGIYGWIHTGGTYSARDGEANHPGIIRRSTSSTISTTSATYLRAVVDTGSFLPAALFDLTWIFRLNVNDANTRLRIGLANSLAATGAPNDGIYLEKDLADTQWFGVCRAASSQTRTAALATVDTDWVTIRLRRIDAGTIGFTLNDGAEVEVTATIPTAALQPGVQLFNNHAADKTVDLDLFHLRITDLDR